MKFLIHLFSRQEIFHMRLIIDELFHNYPLITIRKKVIINGQNSSKM